MEPAMEARANDGRDWSTMPKVELHLHLEGAIPLDALWELIGRHGGDAVVETRDDLERWYSYKDFAHFIEVWTWMNGYLRTYNDFEFAATAVARELVRQNIVYAEAFFSPSDFACHGLHPQSIAAAIRVGLDQVPDVEVSLIVDLVRDRGPKNGARVLAAIKEVAQDTGVIGVGIGGFEAAHPPEPFADVYRDAKDAGLRLTAHAGEADGPRSVWGAIRSLGVERIGHGIRSVEDPELVDYLVEHQIPLEVCPTSNLRTGVVRDWDEHPVTTLVESGTVVTINTDDPAMFHTTLAGEFSTLAERLGFGDSTLKRLSLAAIESSWADDETRTRIGLDIERWWMSPTLES
jgi:adenosine deaminase